MSDRHHPGILFNPRTYDPGELDDESRRLMTGAIAYFESLGKNRITAEDNAGTWYADFCRYLAESEVFATLMTPAGHGDEQSRWDTWRNCHFNEITSFYSLGYWYAWQVSMLGLGPIWMGRNEAAKARAAALLRDGAIFAFGLSEKDHGADIYSSETTLTPDGDGGYVAIDPRNSDVVFVEYQGFPNFWKSVDGGESFVAAVNGITDTDGIFITPFAMDQANPNVLWSGGNRPCQFSSSRLSLNILSSFSCRLASRVSESSLPVAALACN